MIERTLPAGPAIDALIHRLFGQPWPPDRCGVCGAPLHEFIEQGCTSWSCALRPPPARRADDIPPYSVDLTQAWCIVDLLHVRGECVDLAYVDSLHDGMGWQTTFRMTGSFAFAKTPALSICRAALIAAARLGYDSPSAEPMPAEAPHA
jgi:hypothetical protein